MQRNQRQNIGSTQQTKASVPARQNMQHELREHMTMSSSSNLSRPKSGIKIVRRSAHLNVGADFPGEEEMISPHQLHRRDSSASKSSSASSVSASPSTPGSQSGIHRRSHVGSAPSQSRNGQQSTWQQSVARGDPAFRGWMMDSSGKSGTPPTTASPANRAPGTIASPTSPLSAAAWKQIQAEAAMADQNLSPGAEKSVGASSNTKRFKRDSINSTRRASVLISGIASQPTQTIMERQPPSDESPGSDLASVSPPSAGHLAGSVLDVVHRIKASTTISRVMKGHWARTLVFAENKPDNLQILLKTPDSRSYFDCRMVYEAVREKIFFKTKVDMQMGIQLCGVMSLYEAEQDEWLCKQGDEADNFYILYSGSVEIWVNAVKGKPVAVLPTGASFGELGLIRGADRAASVKTTQKMTLLSIGKEDYLRLLKNVSQKEVKKMCAFLGTVDILKGSSITSKSIEKMCYFARTMAVSTGQKIMQENKSADNLHFVMEGQVSISKRHTDLGGKHHVVNVAQLSTGQAFGLSEALESNAKTRKNPVYGFSGASEGKTVILIIHYRDFCRFISTEDFYRFFAAAKDQEDIHMERYKNLLSSRLQLGDSETQDQSSMKSTDLKARKKSIPRARAFRVDDLVGNRKSLKLKESDLSQLQQELNIGADGRKIRKEKLKNHWDMVRKAVFDLNSIEAQLLRSLRRSQLQSKFEQGAGNSANSLLADDTSLTEQQEEMLGPGQFFVNNFSPVDPNVGAGVLEKVLHLLKSNVGSEDRLVLKLSAKMRSKTVLSSQITKIDSMMREATPFVVFVPPPCVSNGEMSHFKVDKQPWAKWHAIFNCTTKDALNVHRAVVKHKLNDIDIDELDYVELMDYIQGKLLSNSLFCVKAKPLSKTSHLAVPGKAQRSGQHCALEVPKRLVEQIHFPTLMHTMQVSQSNINPSNDNAPRASLGSIGLEQRSPTKARVKSCKLLTSSPDVSPAADPAALHPGLHGQGMSTDNLDDDRSSIASSFSGRKVGMRSFASASSSKASNRSFRHLASCTKGALPDFFDDNNEEQNTCRRSDAVNTCQSTSSGGSDSGSYKRFKPSRTASLKRNLPMIDLNATIRDEVVSVASLSKEAPSISPSKPGKGIEVASIEFSRKSSDVKSCESTLPDQAHSESSFNEGVQLVPSPPIRPASSGRASFGLQTVQGKHMSATPRLKRVGGTVPTPSSTRSEEHDWTTKF